MFKVWTAQLHREKVQDTMCEVMFPGGQLQYVCH